MIKAKAVIQRIGSYLAANNIITRKVAQVIELAQVHIIVIYQSVKFNMVFK
jgi:hypothetical protein